MTCHSNDVKRFTSGKISQSERSPSPTIYTTTRLCSQCDFSSFFNPIFTSKHLKRKLRIVFGSSRASVIAGPYSWNMVNLFLFGCHVTERTYASTDCTGRVGETIKRKEGVSQACLGKYWTFTIWSIDSYQNGIATDWHHMTILWAHVSTHRGDVIYLEDDQQLIYLIVGSSLVFL